MSWLDQIFHSRSKNSRPQSGKDLFANYQLTEDRRDQARQQQVKPSPAPGNLFDNAVREHAADEKKQPVRGITATKVHFDGDELEPKLEEPVERGTPRRSAKRIRAPLDFYYFPAPDHYVPLELTVIYKDDRTKVVDCFLYDVNDSGISFTAPEDFPPGSQLTILGHHAEEMTPLIATDALIVNNRRFPEKRPRPARFEGRELWVHGTRMEIQDALLLYKATLDSIALNVALREPGEVDGESTGTPDTEDP